MDSKRGMFMENRFSYPEKIKIERGLRSLYMLTTWMVFAGYPTGLQRSG